MVYIFGFFGFMIGFGIGLGIINVLLRNRSIEQIRADKATKWKYGMLVWLFSAIGAYAGIWIYNNHFF